MGMGRGYCNDFSMSVNAAAAYADGEAPASAWCARPFFKARKIKAVDFSKIDCGISHHTSSRFNETRFFSMDDIAAHLRSIVAAAKERQAREAAATGRGARMARVEWLEWGGSFRHPMCEKRSATCPVEERGQFFTIHLPGQTPLRKKRSCRGLSVRFLQEPNAAL